MAKKSKPSNMKEGVHFDEAKSLQSAPTTAATNPTSPQVSYQSVV